MTQKTFFSIFHHLCLNVSIPPYFLLLNHLFSMFFFHRIIPKAEGPDFTRFSSCSLFLLCCSSSPPSSSPQGLEEDPPTFHSRKFPVDSRAGAEFPLSEMQGRAGCWSPLENDPWGSPSATCFVFSSQRVSSVCLALGRQRMPGLLTSPSVS